MREGNERTHLSALTVAVAAGLATLGGLPVFLFGALAVLIRNELGFSEERLGLAVAVFFAVAALGSLPAGRIADRFGARNSLRAGVGATAVGMAGMAAAQDWMQLTLTLGFTGLGHAVIQVATNLLLSHAVPARMQGLAFGIKQSAIPLATLLAGVAVPLVGLSVGWRWAYAGGAAAAAICALLQFGGNRKVAVQGKRWEPELRVPRRKLTTLAIGVGLGAGAANAYGAFLVAFATDTGLPVGRAGMLLATVSLVGMAVRVGVGRLADLRAAVDLRVVAAMLATGAMALAILSMAESDSALLWAASALGFAGGWGWPGLLTFIVAKKNPDAPAAATGVTQSGIFAGAVAGPLLFGFAVSALSYQAAWTAAATAQLLAAFLVLVVQRSMKTAERPSRR